MTAPIIGSTYGIAPERQTLTEARKREAGKSLWTRAARCLHFLGLL